MTLFNKTKERFIRQKFELFMFKTKNEFLLFNLNNNQFNLFIFLFSRMTYQFI